MSPAVRTTHLARTGLVLAVLAIIAILPACHIGSGFDTAEKRRSLTWQEEPAGATSRDAPATNQPATVEQKQSPPIVYLLVAG